MTLQLLLSGLLLGFSLCSHAQADWQKIKDKDGIRVFRKDSDSSAFKSIKVEAEFEGSWPKLVGILKDIPHHSEWVYKSAGSKLLKKISDSEILYYTITEIPWPMENRDVIIDMKFIEDKAGKAHQIVTQSNPDEMAQQSGNVRVPNLQALWLVKVPEKNKLAITYIISLNPGGSLPAWIVNTFAAKGPFETFKKLGKKLAED
jgi:hypothetical protein